MSKTIVDIPLFGKEEIFYSLSVGAPTILDSALALHNESCKDADDKLRKFNSDVWNAIIPNIQNMLRHHFESDTDENHSVLHIYRFFGFLKSIGDVKVSQSWRTANGVSDIDNNISLDDEEEDQDDEEEEPLSEEAKDELRDEARDDEVKDYDRIMKKTQSEGCVSFDDFLDIEHVLILFQELPRTFPRVFQMQPHIKIVFNAIRQWMVNGFCDNKNGLALALFKESFKHNSKVSGSSSSAQKERKKRSREEETDTLVEFSLPTHLSESNLYQVMFAIRFAYLQEKSDIKDDDVRDLVLCQFNPDDKKFRCPTFARTKEQCVNNLRLFVVANATHTLDYVFPPLVVASALMLKWKLEDLTEDPSLESAVETVNNTESLLSESSAVGVGKKSLTSTPTHTQAPAREETTEPAEPAEPAKPAKKTAKTAKKAKRPKLVD